MKDLNIKYKFSPLPFTGQKYVFLKDIAAILQIWEAMNNKKNKVIIDAFGGSGLISQLCSEIMPGAKVIYNDYDGFLDRVKKIPETNIILKKIQDIFKDTKKNDRLSEEQAQKLISYLKELPGDADFQSIKTWVLHSGKQLDATFDEVVTGKHVFYNCVRKKPIQEVSDYCQNVTITKNAFPLNITQYRAHLDNTAFFVICDPPYTATRSKNYRNSFDIDKFMILYDIEKDILKNRVSYLRFGDITGADIASYKLISDFAHNQYGADYCISNIRRSSLIKEFYATAIYK